MLHAAITTNAAADRDALLRAEARQEYAKAVATNTLGMLMTEAEFVRGYLPVARVISWRKRDEDIRAELVRQRAGASA